MNSKKLIVIGSAAAMSMASFYTHATTGHVGLEACVDALVSELSESTGTPVGYQLDSGGDNFDRKLRSRERISLYARDPQNNELVSKMDCFVDRKGRVLRLKSMPLDSEDTGNLVTKVE
ncbi:MAG TPA: hypothetical protein VIS57_00180 [Xanthomonadales bacterium]